MEKIRVLIANYPMMIPNEVRKLVEGQPGMEIVGDLRGPMRILQEVGRTKADAVILTLDGVEEPNPALLAVMLNQADRLTRLVDQLLDLSRMESGDVPLHLEAVALSPLVEQVLSEVAVSRPDGGRSLDIRNDVPIDLASHMRDLVKRANSPSLQVELGGSMFTDQTQPASEAIGILAAVIILLVAFGSVLATIGLTISAVLTIGLSTRQSVVLGVQGGNLPLLLLTLAVSVVTFTSRKTNVLQGCVHLLLFAVFVLLIFAP